MLLLGWVWVHAKWATGGRPRLAWWVGHQGFFQHYDTMRSCLAVALQAEADTSAATALHELDRRRARFANSLPTEFLLLLRRAWKQQSRDRLPQVGRCRLSQLHAAAG